MQKTTIKAVIKSKYRAKINVEKEMRVALSNLIPRFEKMCSDLQAHPSFNFNVMFNVNVIFMSYLRLVILLLRAGRHGKFLILKKAPRLGKVWEPLH
jgi:hypothetical protein